MDERLRRLLLVPPPIEPVALAPPQKCILLDPFGYISHRTNGSTAYCSASVGGDVPLDMRVTFWPARPPFVSCFTVNCPRLPITVFGNLPKIVTTEDDLVLLRVNLRPHGAHLDDDINDYFVYQAGGQNKGPSLRLIPRAPVLEFSDGEAVLLRRRASNMFFIAILHRQMSNPLQFDLHLYNSLTGKWSTRSMSSPEHFDFTNATKGLTIGGPLGSVGWVDLERGILICDLLGSNHLRYISLPSPIVSKPLQGPPSYVRDIIAVDGVIKYFDMHILRNECPYIIDGGKARTMILKKNSSSWEEDCSSKLSMVGLTHPEFAELLERLQFNKDKQSVLVDSYVGYPALSLDRDAVYIMNKVQRRGQIAEQAWVIAVSMRQQISLSFKHRFSPGRPLGFYYNLLQSGISEHLNIFAGNSLKEWKRGSGLRSRFPRITLVKDMANSK